MRWNRKSTGARFLGTLMGGVYARPEMMSSDPYFADREVFEVHPFLPLWLEEQAEKVGAATTGDQGALQQRG
jgi:hypothetical protein